MTQIEALQMDIHNTRMELHKFRKNATVDPIQRMHVDAAIEYCLEELKDLRFSLSEAVKQKCK
jgi:hypothetical protein